MKNSLLFFFLGSMLTFTGYSQDCFTKLQKAFDDRGANAVANDIHRNVIISFFEGPANTYCIAGKVRVENGMITAIFLEYEDGTFELMESKFYNSMKQPPIIVNGISEMIFNADSEKFRVVFIEALKPKKKSFKTVELPSDL